MFNLIKESYYFIKNSVENKNDISKISSSVIFDIMITSFSAAKMIIISELINKVTNQTKEFEGREREYPDDLTYLSIIFLLVQGLIISATYLKQNIIKGVEYKVQNKIFIDSIGKIYEFQKDMGNAEDLPSLIYRRFDNTERHASNLFPLYTSIIFPTLSDSVISYIIYSYYNSMFAYAAPLYILLQFISHNKFREFLQIDESLQKITDSSVSLRRKMELDIQNIHLIISSNKTNYEGKQLIYFIEKYIKSQFIYDAKSKNHATINNLNNYIIKIILIYFFSDIKNIFSNCYLFISAIDAISENISTLSKGLNSVKLSINYLKEIYTKDMFNKTFILPKKSTISINEPSFNLPRKNDPLNITFSNINFRYPGTNRYIFKDFSLNIEAGKSTAIIGESGIGKSTIIKLIAGIYKPESGNIYINDVNIQNIPRQYLYELIGFLSQEIQIIKEYSVLDNLFYSTDNIPNDSLHSASRLLARVGIFNINHATKCSSLSTGQNLRIGIARLLAQNPPIIVLDEHTAALDSFTEASINEISKELTFNRTILMVGHRLSTIKYANKIIVLGIEGKILQSGSHDKLLLDRNGFYARSWNLQMGLTT